MSTSCNIPSAEKLNYDVYEILYICFLVFFILFLLIAIGAFGCYQYNPEPFTNAKKYAENILLAKYKVPDLKNNLDIQAMSVPKIIEQPEIKEEQYKTNAPFIQGEELLKNLYSNKIKNTEVIKEETLEDRLKNISNGGILS